MRLATVDDILQFIRFDSIDELNLALDSALLTASVSLEALLRTSFDRVEEAVDYYYVEHTEFIGQEYSVYLQTNNGFIDSDSLSVVYAETKAELATGTDITEYCTVDYVKGKILIAGLNLDSLWVKVSYSSGFTVTEDDPITYENVPSWLERAAVVQSVLEFDRANPDFRKENSGTRINMEELQVHLNGAVSKHIRFLPYCLMPVM